MTAATHPRPGRNEPCHCGSGRKYKQCCLAKDEAAAAQARAKAAAETAASTDASAEDVPAEHAKPGAAAPAPPKAKHKTHQPWRATASRGFVPQMRTPRKAGGS